MQWKEGQVSLSILEKFSSGFFLAGQPAIPILDANPTHCQTASKILQGRVAAYYYCSCSLMQSNAHTSPDDINLTDHSVFLGGGLEYLIQNEILQFQHRRTVVT